MKRLAGKLYRGADSKKCNVYLPAGYDETDKDKNIMSFTFSMEWVEAAMSGYMVAAGLMALCYL